MQDGPDFSLERISGGNAIGVDEVGRGPIAGPVVAAAVYIPPTHWGCSPPLNDSKKLSKRKRELYYDWIVANTRHAIVGISVEEIDKINILQASKRAMEHAIAALAYDDAHVLIDGNQPLNIAHSQETVVGGDRLSMSIAASSILAKVYRDRLMRRYHEEMPYYGWDTNAGYGTKTHIEALKTYGVSRHHRRSFAPVADALRMERVSSCA